MPSEADTCRKYVVPLLQAADVRVIDWISAVVPCGHASQICGGRLAQISKEGEIEWQVVRSESVPGSHDSSLQVQTRGPNLQDAHHFVPLGNLATDGPVSMDPVKDFAVLCANCHRMIHQMGCPRLDEFRKRISVEFVSLTNAAMTAAP